MSLFERIIAEVRAERARQDEKWGIQNHPMTLNGDAAFWREQADGWKTENDERVAHGNALGRPKDRNCAWDGILAEEMAETFAEERPGLQYAEAVQTAGVAFAILDYLNRISMELFGHYAGCPALDVDGVETAPEACDCAEDNGTVTEYATAFKSGNMVLLVDAPEVEKVYPMAERIAHKQKFHETVYTRTVQIVEDWKEAKMRNEARS